MSVKKKKGDLLLSTISMTGYGRSSHCSETVALEVEIKSLNSRSLDVVCRLPREYGQFEIGLRELLASKLKRGRVEISVTRRALQRSDLNYQFNRTLFNEYMRLWKELAKEQGLKVNAEICAPTVREALARREILDVIEGVSAVDSEKAALFAAVKEALDVLCESRKREGVRLGQNLFARLPQLTSLLERMGKLALNNNELLRERLSQKVATLGIELALDKGRLAAEVALLADRQDVSEELVRLGVHIGEIGNSLGASSSGRKLDFLFQECSREINTLGAKTVDMSLQELALEMKLELERMREQVQNIE